MSELVNTKLRVDLPTLQAIAARIWGKEDELKALKSELAVLDRKITAELAPKHDEKDGEEIKRDEQTKQSGKIMYHDNPQKEQTGNSSMVAEPVTKYNTTGLPLRQSIRLLIINNESRGIRHLCFHYIS